MKRFSLFTALSVALLMFGLAACTGDTSTETEPAATVSDDTAPEVVPGTYTIDAVHSDIGFRARHLGISNVDGRFSDVEGTITLSDDLASMQAEATIQTASVDTRNEDRDNHLRSPDFFDAENHPSITFTSTSVEPLGGGRFRMNGNLTIRDTTQSVTLEGEYLGGVTGPQGNPIVAFSSEGEINRMDYGVSWNNTLDTGGLIVGETIGLTVNVEAAGEASGMEDEAEGGDGEAMEEGQDA